MSGTILAFGVGVIFVAAIYVIVNFFSGGNTQIQSGGSRSIQIQSGGVGSVSISNKSGHVVIKGRVKSVTVNGRKIYAQ